MYCSVNPHKWETFKYESGDIFSLFDWWLMSTKGAQRGQRRSTAMALPRAHAPPNRGHAAGAKRFQLCSSATTRGPEDELSISNKFPGLTCYICLMWSNRFAKRMSEASKLTSLFLICSCGAINLPAIVVSRISMWMTVSNPSFPFLFPGWVKTKRGTREEFLSPLPASRLHTIELSSSTLQWASGRKIQSPDSTLPLTFKGQVSLYRT